MPDPMPHGHASGRRASRGLPDEQLSAQHERLALLAVRRAYTHFNLTIFRGLLRTPTLELTDSRERLGGWIRQYRRLELSRSLLLEHSWGVLLEVLKHEMAHQYVDEITGCHDEASHGRTFQKVCAERGIDSSPSGIPQSTGAPSPILDRIAKLLALAESPNEHEAQAAMNAAQRLMLKYNIEEVTTGSSRAYSFRQLGRATGRVSESERILACMLSDHFFVDCIWVSVWRPLDGKRGSVLEVCGNVENLEMAEYVHSFLTHTAERLWREHKRARRIRGNADRRAFVAGVMTGFREQLEAQARQNASEGLVWAGDPDLGRYFKRRHPHIRWTRHASSLGSSAHQDGREHGRKIVLHRGVGSGPSGAPKLLPR
jgi:hypothetical protein